MDSNHKNLIGYAPLQYWMHQAYLSDTRTRNLRLACYTPLMPEHQCRRTEEYSSESSSQCGLQLEGRDSVMTDNSKYLA
jgi:hypothetical protein